VLDVSGTQHVAVPMERNFVPIRLLGDELKDSPNNQDGYLYRKEVWVDLRRRPPLISNIDGYLAQVGRTAGERTTDRRQRQIPVAWRGDSARGLEH
jgi:hypothetical protein